MRYVVAAAPPAALFIARNFIDASLCARLLDEVCRGRLEPAPISAGPGKDLLDERRRRTARVSVTAPAREAAAACFERLLPGLERHFRLRLSGLQTPQFLRYRRGDFFCAHQDSSAHRAHDIDVRTRKVSAVLFLNRQTPLPDTGAYCGGELKLYRLDEDRDPALHVAGEAGLVVAFPSHLVHEVRPVTHGERYTVVTWYAGEDPAAP